jgi:hypothetical protein
VSEPDSLGPELDSWLPRPHISVRHRRVAAVEAAALWAAARSTRLSDAGQLGRLVRLRIPGLAPELTFDAMFHATPFTVLQESKYALLSGLVGRIWTLRRDYPTLTEPQSFLEWSERGTVKVLFANWVEPVDAGRAALASETRIATVDRWSRIGLAAVRPLILSSHRLISSDGFDAALRRAQRESDHSDG